MLCINHLKQTALLVNMYADEQEGYFLIGWQKLSRLRAIDEDTQIRFEWPNADVFNIRVGSEFPYAAEDEARSEQPSDKEDSS